MLPISINFVFIKLRLSLFFLNQFNMLVNSGINLSLMSLTLLTLVERFVSSAYIHILPFLTTFGKSYGVPSTTKFKLSNFVVGHAIVIFEHAIMIFKHAIVQIEHAIMILKHAIVQMKYEIRNGMLILSFNMKPLIGLFKANIHYGAVAFVFEGHSTFLMFNSELHPVITICNASFRMRSDAFLLRSSQLKDNSPALTCGQAVYQYQVN